MEPAHSVRELARRLNLSPATVSKALRGHVAVAKETRERVLIGAREHGFHPNPQMTRALNRPRDKASSSRTTIAIAYLYSEPHGKSLELRDYHIMLAEAEDRGFLLEKFNLQDYPSLPHLRNILFNRGFQAIVWGSFERPCDLSGVDWGDFVLVKITRHSVTPRIPCLRSAVGDGIRLMWRKIDENGFRRPGIILYERDPMLEDDRDRLGAWLVEAQLRPENKPVPPLRTISGRQLTPGVLQNWFEQHQPDVVVGFNRFTRMQFDEAGIQLPGDHPYFQLSVEPDEMGIEGIRGTVKILAKQVVPFIEHLLNTGRFGIPADIEDLVIQPHWISPR